jgi:uncharacterized protein YidB (DUF937 family)
MKINRDQAMFAYLRWCMGDGTTASLAAELGISQSRMSSRFATIRRLVEKARQRGDGEMLLRWASCQPPLPRAADAGEQALWLRAKRQSDERLRLAAWWALRGQRTVLPAPAR